jgi:hypothetical protein
MAESDIFVRFGADIDPLKRGTKDASNSLQAFGNKTKQTSVNLAKMAAVAAVAAAAIGVKLVNDSLSAIDAQAKMAKQLGTSSASLATLSRAADMSGISMGSIEKGAKNLEVAMGEAAGGTGEALKTLERLNLTAKDLEGMTLDEKILTVNKALKDNVPANERASAAADLFGKKAGFAIAQLSPETIKEAARQVEGMGLAISDFDAAKIEAANDAMATVGMAVDGVAQQLTIVLAPILEDIATRFQEAAIESGGFKEEAISAVNGVASAVGFVADAFHGVGLAIDGVIVLFKALNAAGLAVTDQVASYLSSLSQGFAATLNEIIDLANNIPGVDISNIIIGQSELVTGIKDAALEANAELQTAQDELHKKLMAPLPSEQIDSFIASLGADQIINEESAKLATLQKLRESWEAGSIEGGKKFYSDLSTLTQSGNEELFKSLTELHNKTMQPLPPEVIDAYIASLGTDRIIEEAILKNQKLADIDRLAKETALSEETSFYGKMKQVKEAWTTNETDAVATMFGNLASLMQTGNKKMFEIGKTAAKAQTVVSTISSAQKSYESLSGIPVIGPALGIAAAGAAVIAGGVRLNAINSTSFGGGGSVSAAAGGAGGSVAAPTSAAIPEQRRTVSVQSMDPNSLVSGSMVNSIAEQLVELQNDGFKLVV